MGQVIGTIIFVIIALIVVTTVGSLIIAVIGTFLGLIPFLIKLMVWGGLFYLCWLIFRKITHSTAE
jgi:hypothetical protein